jgi:hypothetical protein
MRGAIPFKTPAPPRGMGFDWAARVWLTPTLSRKRERGADGASFLSLRKSPGTYN